MLFLTHRRARFNTRSSHLQSLSSASMMTVGPGVMPHRTDGTHAGFTTEDTVRGAAIRGQLKAFGLDPEQMRGSSPHRPALPLGRQPTAHARSASCIGNPTA